MIGPKPIPPKLRFEKMFIASPNCWEWIGALSKGYGSFRFTKTNDSAHRVAWMLYRGKIPNGVCVLHKCDNKRCVNPNHLYLGDHKQNMRDAIERKQWKPFLGESHPSAKLTWNEVHEIRHDHRLTKEPACTIAKRYGVSGGCIDHILSGRHWKEHHPSQQGER